jgi:DNA-binding response OmpR family regulator
MRVLIVEDEEPARLGLSAVLSHERGHSVDLAASIDAAADLMRRHAYDLIILDVRLEGGQTLKDVPFRVAGKEMLLRLRSGHLGELKARAGTPVVAITAVSDVEVNQALEEAGNILVLAKPIDPDDALQRIEAFLKERGDECA